MTKDTLNYINVIMIGRGEILSIEELLLIKDVVTSKRKQYLEIYDSNQLKYVIPGIDKLLEEIELLLKDKCSRRSAV